MTAALNLDAPPAIESLGRLRAASRELREDSGRLRAMAARVREARLDDLPFPSAVLDTTGRVVAVNAAFMQDYPRVVVGARVRDLLSPSCADMFDRALRRVRDRGTAEVSVSYEGSSRPWRLTASADRHIAVGA